MNNGSRLLSLRGLRTFCVAARLGSFRATAEELFLTPSAVSHRIKGLEDELGIELFERSGRSLSLTESGARLFHEIDPPVRQIDAVTMQYRQRVTPQPLRLSVQPFFASELLVPRLGGFTAAHPGIELRVDTDDAATARLPATADAAIRLFRTPPPNTSSDALFALRLAPACSPAMRARIINGNVWPGEPFSLIVNSKRPKAWKHWAESAGIAIPDHASVIALTSMIAVARAAEQGVGIALVPLPLSNEWFDSGRLVRVHGHELVTNDRYYFAFHDGKGNDEAVAVMRQWVLQTFANDT